MENSFPQFVFIDKYLEFKEILYLIHEVKFEMRPALFYVSSHRCFQQSNSNWDMVFLIHPL